MAVCILVEKNFDVVGAMVKACVEVTIVDWVGVVVLTEAAACVFDEKSVAACDVSDTIVVFKVVSAGSAGADVVVGGIIVAAVVTGAEHNPQLRGQFNNTEI